jgi:hypothetical protein
VCAGEGFQQFRRFSFSKFVRTVSKDFSQIPLCYHSVVLVFRRSLRRFPAPGFRNVLRSPAVAFPGPDRLSAPIKFFRHQNFVSRARCERKKKGDAVEVPWRWLPGTRLWGQAFLNEKHTKPKPNVEILGRKGRVWLRETSTLDARNVNMASIVFE